VRQSNVFYEFGKQNAGFEIGSKKNTAASILCDGTNRLICSLAFLLCILGTSLVYIALHGLCLMIFGNAVFELSYTEQDVISYFEILTAVFLSLPLYHGYSIMICGTYEKRRADIADMLIPFSSVRTFLCSFFVTAMSFLSAAVPVTAITLFAMTNGMGFFVSVSFIVTPLWIFLCSLFRRMCRLHAFCPDLSFSDCLICAFSAPKSLKREMTVCAFSFTGMYILSAVTVLIYGIWNGFAIKNLCAAMYAEELIEEYKIKKDRELL